MKTQKELFEVILTRFKSRVEMYAHVSALLSVSTDTVSKWSYGKTYIRYDRLMKLVGHFVLSPGDLHQSRTDEVTFRFAPLDMDDIPGYCHYIRGFREMLQRVVEAPDVHICFHADELPIFYFMPYVELVYFKLYSFAHDTLKVELSYEQFVKRMEEYKLDTVFEEIAALYERIPSVEVWDDAVIDSLLYQIDHFQVLERYDDPDSRSLILGQLDELLEDFRKTAAAGVKSSGVRFDFYRRHSPAKKGYMLLRDNGRISLSIKTDTINSMYTQAQGIVEAFVGSFNATINKSTAVGIGAERERTVFFRNLKTKIEFALTKD
ncbi:hypothetical protein [Sphingobacterium paucimobilis]|uniref:Transcription regulator BetR N-terminal domain-containing protein n=1 Tax=Sphingobacterium paucimobilis HER1398 TaxID=1346330 RepID=U2JDY6_9SPHI|nr:hypothetical protein [Sphingobacterium paucimobilis]ERJ60893.1 hypothetical protein M472_19240 [Sphingobacterium paucimobilis HER1398]